MRRGSEQRLLEDPLVAEASVDEDVRVVVEIDPVNGAQRVVSNDPIFSWPTGIVVDRDGTLLVSDLSLDGVGGLDGLVRLSLDGTILETYLGSEASLLTALGYTGVAHCVEYCLSEARHRLGAAVTSERSGRGGPA